MKLIAMSLIAASALALSCAKREPPQQAEPPVIGPNPVAEVTALKGDVKTFANGEWSDAVVGRVLLADDSLDVPAKASCELKDATGLTAKLSGAKDEVAKLLDAGKQAPARKPMIKALSSIKKLDSKPKFQVTTPTAVAGVRGTKGRQPLPDTARQDTSSHK
jgi:hypothetical protein